MASSRRLDGWKAIGGHFGRDRTTVMRWAQSRGLPVRRLPGGKTGTVFAFVDELDKWAANQTDLTAETPENTNAETDTQPAPAPGFWQRNWRRLAVVSLMGTALIFALGNVWPRPQPVPASQGLPADPALASLYLEARDAWAQRTPQSLKRAITLFTTLIEKQPDSALAWAGLADAYLLSREFGEMTDEDAFTKARAAALKASQLDANLSSPHRALGFISYWWENDPAKAGDAFRRALSLKPGEAQTHFWYGNVLSDNGQHSAALKELNTARLIEPGSISIQIDLAWAQWAAGDDAAAKAAFGQLRQQNASSPVLFDCTSLIKLADGDYVGYVQDFSEFARLRDESDLKAYAAQLRSSLKSGAPAVQALLMKKALEEVAANPRRTHVWPVFLASVAQNRADVVRFLKTATERGESWGEAGLSARIARLWPDDAEINTLLQSLRDRRAA